MATWTEDRPHKHKRIEDLDRGKQHSHRERAMRKCKLEREGERWNLLGTKIQISGWMRHWQPGGPTMADGLFTAYRVLINSAGLQSFFASFLAQCFGFSSDLLSKEALYRVRGTIDWIWLRVKDGVLHIYLRQENRRLESWEKGHLTFFLGPALLLFSL